MLSYQHAYHAGNPADVHKHALLAALLGYMVLKPKPLSYLETHAGRALYDLSAPEAVKTGEAMAGVGRLERRFRPDHPWRRALDAAREMHGTRVYPGSPLVAALTLRDGDRVHLAELHPQEHGALKDVMGRWGGQVHRRDGLEMAVALTPPEPRRGLMLIDPSWEVKEDYQAIPQVMAQVHRKWPVGVIVLWYPILAAGLERAMLRDLAARFPDGFRHEVTFPPVRPGHRMVGSGLFVVNPPYGTAAAAAEIAEVFRDA